jgi:hypothetical protein
MSDRVQIGVEVDREVWERYREWVDSKHGKTRGVLGDEVENALRKQIGEEITPGVARIESRLARIESEIGATAADGSGATVESDEHTHAPSRLDTDKKPAANAATEKKVAYLAECVRNSEVPNGSELAMVPRDTLVSVVKDEYGFRSDTAKRYVESLIDHFDLKDHPHNDKILVSEDRHTEILRQEADEQLEGR